MLHVEQKSGQALMDSLVKVTQDQCQCQVLARMVSSLEVLEDSLHLSSFGCLQHLAPCDCKTEVPFVVLAVSQGLLSTPSGQTAVIAHGSFHLQVSSGMLICLVLCTYLTASTVARWGKPSAFKGPTESD